MTQELELVKAKQMAEFQLTPVGQQLKRFEITQRMAQMYQTSTIVPQSYAGNIGNCAIAIDMAMRMNANPLMVMQNLYIVHGNPSFSSKFLIATINACGKFTPLRYEFKGKEDSDAWACRCYAYEISDREHKEPLYGDWVSIGMAKVEGWSTKNGSKWRTMPGQMLRYRAAAFWQRVYAPEISMGFLTTEEYQDIDDQSGTMTVAEEIRTKANKKEVDVTKTIEVDTETGEVVEESPAAAPEEQPIGASNDLPDFMQG